MSVSRVIRWLNDGDWIAPLLLSVLVAVVGFLVALFRAAAQSGWPRDVPDALILKAWPVSAAIVGAVVLFFWQGWPRITKWAEEREYRGHRESSQSAGSTAGTIQAAIDRAARTLTPASAGVGPSPEPVAQEILAERAWQLSPHRDGRAILYSATRPVSWEGPTLRADSLPTEGNHHGIHGLQSLKGSGYDQYSVVGTIALSGRVVQGERGYRAEQATIRSLRLRHLPATYPIYSDPFFGLQSPEIPAEWSARAWDVAEQLADRYQCEVTVDWTPTSNLPAKELVV